MCRARAKRPADTAAAPCSAQKPKIAPIREPWTSPLADAGGGGRTGSFEAIIDSSVTPPHTLLVGTQPATKSIANGWYFADDRNAFWHIVGHALGFRRGFHENAARGDVVPSIAMHLRGGEYHPHEQRDEVVADYEGRGLEAAGRLRSMGHPRIVERKSKKSGRQSSLDSDIRKAKKADIEGLVRRHPPSAGSSSSRAKAPPTCSASTSVSGERPPRPRNKTAFPPFRPTLSHSLTHFDLGRNTQPCSSRGAS